jgi:multidrug resistance efflux pump
MKLGPEQSVQMPMKTVVSLIVLVSIFTFSYFQITERLNILETQDTLMQSDLLKKAEQTPKNLEIFMLLEELFKQTDKQQILLDNNIHTQIKLEHLEDQLEKALQDIEKLKDKVRENGNSYSANNVSR